MLLTGVTRKRMSGGVSPSNTVSPVASVPYAIAGQTITCTEGTWSGTEPITKTYQLQSSVDGVSGWTNVSGATSNSYLIPSSAAQLLFYRWAVTGSNGIGLPVIAYSNVVGGVDSQANTHFNRVTTDSGVMTYGLVGVDTGVKTIKFIYNITDITTLNIDAKLLDYFGYRTGSGTGTTAGRALMKAYSILGANFDYVETRLANQPFLAAFDGTNKYLMMQGSLDVGMSTPNNVNNQLTTDFGIEFRANIGATGGICGKSLGGSDANFVVSRSSNNIVIRIGQGGTLYVYTSTATTTNQYIRISRNSTTGIIKFFSSSNGVSYTQLGSDVAGVTGAVANPATVVWVGFARGIGGCTGEIYYVNFYKDDSFTTITQNFNMSAYNRSVSQTTLTASTSEVWSLTVPTTATGFKPMLVDQTMIQGNGTSTGMHAASASLNNLVFTQYSVFRKFSNATTATGILTEYGTSIASGQGAAIIPNENTNTESVYTRSNVGLSGTSWIANSTLLKVVTFRANINGSPYEQGYLTNNVANTFNAVQSPDDNTTAIVATSKNLLARNNAASGWLNAIWVGEIMTTQTDTTTQEANIYNMLADLTNII